MKVGFVGLGRMGKPMALKLLEAGHEVTVHNRRRGPVEALVAQGARPASSPAEVAAGTDFVLTALTNTASVEEVYLGERGLVPAARPGQVLIDHSTVSPATSRQIAEQARARGADFLDAPVSGGPAGAQAGTLTIMVGGAPETFERARPLFEVLGQKLHYVGPTGSGSVVKLVNQLLVGIHSAAAAEAMAFGVKAGADPRVLLDIVGSSFGASRMLTRNAPLMLERKFEAATSVNLILKDLTLIGDLAQQVDARLLLGSLAQQVFLEARACGFGEQDMAAVVRPLEALEQIEVVSKE
ncbi:MAG: NAD(P)-dependent oxidoreductase [Chloroflexi bacterium]|nr:NAD(P)-dependent oxidoreductase [Chloroflexota bacterium]